MIHIYRYKEPINIILICLVASFLFFSSCRNSNSGRNKNDITLESNDLQQIRQEGILRVVVDYNSTNYFVYRGRPMGFKYELLQALANDLGVKLEISVSNNLKETFEGLKEERFDLVAKNLTITKERTKEVDFTVPLMQTSQVLVQRATTGAENDSIYVNSTLDLARKKVHVQKNTSFYRRLMHLSDEIGQNIRIEEDTIYGVEQLVVLVAKGEIDYTVCDENIAELNQTYYPNLDVSLKVSFPQNIAWAVRKGSDDWRNYLNEWIIDFKKTRKFRQLYHHYFKSARTTKRRESEFHSISGGKISKYDDKIKELALQYNWDWRLIAALIYQESRFNAEAGSWAGAYGLMQLMPTTAKSLGVNYENPHENIKGGILLMNWLNKQFLEEIPDSTERIKFILASYNIGLGHVKDAQRLSKKYGKNRIVWDDNVDYYLKAKSSEKYFKDPVVKYGYCRGEETYRYVRKVIHNYQHYLNVISY